MIFVQIYPYPPCNCQKKQQLNVAMHVAYVFFQFFSGHCMLDFFPAWQVDEMILVLDSQMRFGWFPLNNFSSINRFKETLV